MLSQDSVYARRPWQSLPEQQVSDLLSEWTSMPADAIRRMGPPVPNVGTPPPPRFGYQHRVLRIQDIARLDDLYPGARVDNSVRRSGLPTTTFPVRGVM